MMKKVVIALMIMLVVAMGAMALTGCGAKGTYYFDSMTVGNKTYNLGEEKDGSELNKEYYKLELESDGKAKLTIVGVTTSYKWEEEDGKIVLKGANTGLKVYTLERNGRKLTGDILGAKVTLKK